MKKSPVVLLLAVLWLAGCAQLKTIVTLHADGSGFIEHEIVPTAALQELLALMSEGEYFMDEAQLRAYAAGLGEGVTYVSHEAIDDGNGLRVRFHFDDVRTLRLEPANPADFIAFEGMTSEESESPPITFGFEAGAPSTLTIALPDRDAGAEADSSETPDPAEEEAALEQMRAMMQDARISFAVETPGAIRETNAAHHEASLITIVDIDFNEFLKDDALIRQIAAHPEPSPELLATLAGHGFRIETQDSVRVVFD